MLTNIKHIVHVMFENRSIDNVLGWLYANQNNRPPHMIITGADRPPATPFYLGLKENTYFNLDKDGKKHYVTKGTGGDMSVPTFDPNEEYQFVNNQCFEVTSGNPVYPTMASMGGFYKDYATWYDSASQIMMTYTPQELPVLNGLAGSFAVCDKWFASLPTQTNCNRAFAATGNSIGYNPNTRVKNAWVNNQFDVFTLKVNFSEKTVWNVLSDNGYNSPDDWMIFYSEVWPPVEPWQKFCYTRDMFEQLKAPQFDRNFAPIDDFMAKARQGQLPAYSFLEPDWGLKKWHIGINGNDYHPPCNLGPGEKFLNDIYNAVTANRNAWNQTLLVVTFDEHGGTYDHEFTPWGAKPPWGKNPAPPCEMDFGFNRFGVRVPAVFASPYIEAGTVFRSDVTCVPYDHTSLISTVLQWKNIPRYKWNLGERVLNAPTFEAILTRNTPRTDIPHFTPRSDFEANQDPPANDLQWQIARRALVHTADKLNLDDQTVKAIHATHLEPAQTIGELSKGLSEGLQAMAGMGKAHKPKTGFCAFIRSLFGGKK